MVWFPLAIFAFHILHDKPSGTLPLDDYTIFQAASCWAYTGGIWMALIFYRNSSEARERWRHFFKISLFPNREELSRSADIRKEFSNEESQDNVDRNEASLFCEEDFLIDDEMIENIAVTEDEEMVRVAGSPSVDITFETRSNSGNSLFHLFGNRPSGLSFSSNRPSNTSAIELSSMGSDSITNRFSVDSTINEIIASHESDEADKVKEGKVCINGDDDDGHVASGIHLEDQTAHQDDIPSSIS